MTGDTRKSSSIKGVPLIKCDACGRSHQKGSGRHAACAGVHRGVAAPQVRTSPQGAANSTFAIGEFSRLGEGARDRDEPMPHAVFSRQMLPRSVESKTQARSETVSTDSDSGRKLVAEMRAASRSAVHAWRRLGISPTQEMMSDMDVFPEEVEELLESHMQSAHDAAEQKYAGLGISVATSSISPENARRQCLHAVRTAKGLAVSPTNIQRLLVRVLDGEAYDSTDFVRTAIFLRSVADSSSDIENFLSKDSESLTAEDIAPVVRLMRNIGHIKDGAVVFRGEELTEIEPSFTSDHLSRLSRSDYEELEEWCSLVSNNDEGIVVGPTDNLRGLPALPIELSKELLVNDLDYGSWRYYGWEDGRMHTRSVVLLEPQLVKMRRDGIPDGIIAAMRSGVTSQDDSYPYSTHIFLGGPGAHAVSGRSSLGSLNLGHSDEEPNKIRAKTKLRNAKAY